MSEHVLNIDLTSYSDILEKKRTRRIYINFFSMTFIISYCYVLINVNNILF